MSCRPGPEDGFAAGSTWVPLPADEVLAMARLEPMFSGRFDDSGQALVRPGALVDRAPCPLSACLLLLNDDPGPDVEAVPPGPVPAPERAPEFPDPALSEYDGLISTLPRKRQHSKAYKSTFNSSMQ